MTRLLLLIFLISLVGCGGSQTGEALLSGHLDESNTPEVKDASESFTLKVLPESYYGGASGEISLSVEEQAEQVLVTLNAEDAVGLRALYFELDYDAARYRPVEAKPAAQFGAEEELLTLTVAQQQGTLHHGQVLVHPQDQAGFSGSGAVAVVRFALSPDPLRRVVSQAPSTDPSAALLTLDEVNGQLLWGYTSQGDYDQNSETNIADLTPIGIHFKVGGGPFEYYTIESVVDGDNNGEINIADITPIGINFQRRVNSYNVYNSDTPETDYPTSNDAFSTVPQLISIGYLNFTGNRGNERVAYNFDLTGQPQNTTYWVRPVDGQSIGTPSNALEVPFLTAPIPTASVTASPDSGFVPLDVDFDASGSTTPEGVLTDFEWDFDNDGNFNEADNGEDVAQGSPTASFLFVTPGTYDVIVRVTNEFGFSATGGASVSANLEPNVGPTADITGSPLSGKAPLNINFDASGSFDTDGTIVEYEWDFNGDGIFDTSTGGVATTSHIFNSAGNFDVAVRVTDDDGASDTASMSETGGGVITINPPNEAPDAAITADVTTGPTPLDVNFDASGSTDSDGTIVQYEWDFDGNGTFEVNSGGDATVSHTYNASGDFDPAVRVTDNDGATDEASLSETLPGGITVNNPPSAFLSADSSGGPVPLEVNFDASLSTDSDGTIVNYQWDFDGDGIYDLDTGASATTMFIYNSQGTFDPVVKVTDDDGAFDEASLSESGGTPIEPVLADPPVAALEATPLSGDAPLVVDFDASASTDNGTIVSFEWDFFNDGDFELNTGTTATTQYVYGQIGAHSATVRVTDDDGQTDTASVVITLESGWDSSTGIVDVLMDSKASIATFADGGPGARVGIAYKNASSDDLCFVLSSDDTAFLWEAPVTILSSGQVGDDCTLAEINGLPSISFQRANSKLDFIQATTADGSDWPNDSTEADGGGGAGAFTSLVEVNGNPAISNIRAGKDDLRYGRATNSDGTDWDPAFDVEAAVGGGDEIEFTDLLMVNGSPAILFNYVGSSTGLKFVRATENNGAEYAAPVTIDAPQAGGRYPSLSIVDGQPATSYQAFETDTLRYCRAADVNGGVWASFVTVDAGADIGEWTTLRVVDGVPAIAYYEPDGGNLKCAFGNDAQGTSFTPMYVDISGDVGRFASMTVINDIPVIAYYDSTNGRLKIAVFVPPAP